MRRSGVKREKAKKINKMTAVELTNLIKGLEVAKQHESKVYMAAVQQLSLK